MAFLA
ncbi:hypothetical protein YPPY06_0434, partial [Yersinia pestis PY-06]